MEAKAMADGFLGRWSQRKEAVRKGQELPPAPQKAVVAAPAPPPEASAAAGGGEETQQAPPPPTLDDVQALSRDCDFTRFVQPDVAPEVKKAAFKKLFTDPHFNVMDGLDTYIDDYGKPDPIPPEMLKQLVSARFLRLFEEKEEEPQEDKAPTVVEAADDLPPETVAQSDFRTEQALPPADDHADPDLRLQQDDAPGPEGPGAGSR
jgi:hypothetical protein